jgi:hypothetical protein
MPKCVRGIVTAALIVLLPSLASAQSSGIAGVVRDTSGAVLPGVTVEVTSPALIEKVRTAVTDDAGRYNVIQLRPGIYSVTFTLPGFSTVRRDGIELTADFTAPVDGEMRIGAIEETITVAAETPVVDVQSITSRTVMTRDVLDAIPSGRNIQAVGIMIPGTTLALGGGGALSRDVGGSGGLQQSPLQYRGSADTVQTIEGLRLNNLCAQGAYSGVYWNDGSLQEISYVTGADSAEMGQGGIRVNMVPKDGGNTFRGSIFANFTGDGWDANNLGDTLTGDLTYNPNNRLTNVSRIKKIWDINPSIGGPLRQDKLWFNFTFRHWGVERTVADSFADLDPRPAFYVPDLNNPGVDDGHIVSRAGRLAWQIGEKDKLTVYHDDQRKYRDHWGISANVPPDASAIQVTPTSFVNVTRWTRTQSNRVFFDVGVGIYDQEYTELYQPSVINGYSEKQWNLDQIRQSRVYTLCDNNTGTCALVQGKLTGAWPNPADHFSLLRTVSGSMSYVTGSHAMKFGGSFSNGDWREISARTGDAQPVEFTGGAATALTLRLPIDRRNGIKADTGIYAQDRWSVGRATVNLGLRYDWFIGETQESEVLASRLPGALALGMTYGKCADGKNDSRAGCVGKVQDWKDISPRVGISYDLFGNGRTAIKTSVARYVAGQQIAVANANNPVTVLGLSDRRPWTDRDGNGLPYDANGNIQFNELADSVTTASFGRNISTTTTDPEVLNGWFKREFNWEYGASIQHELFARTSVGAGWFRREFGNQTFVDDLRFGPEDYDGPFCINAPLNGNLPNGGGYQVCGLRDLKPASLAARPVPNNLIRFSEDFGGETNVFSGFDLNIESRFREGAFVRAGVTAGRRTFDQCGLQQAGFDANNGAAAPVFVGQEIYPDGTTYCHREYPYRPDFKFLGSYTLPYGVMFSGTYQFSRGVQTGGAGPSILGTWTLAGASFAPGGSSNGVPVGSTLGRALNAASATKSVQLIREGLEYGEQNLSQLDLRASKRFTVARYRFRVDVDLYNVFNNNWPYTVQSAFSTSPTTSVWLRPTNVLQGRLFKIGGQFDF